MPEGQITPAEWRTERLQLDQLTSDPSNPQPGDEWLRVDQKPTYEDANGNSQTALAQYRRVQDDGTTITAPVAQLGDATAAEVIDKVRANVTDGGSPTGKGFVPYALSSSSPSYPKRRLQHPVDGQVGLHDALTVSTIPDSEDLHARFDASDKTSVSSWVNETSEADLDAFGSPTIQTSDKNGLNTVLYDGTDDYHATDWNSAISQPYQIFVVFVNDDISLDSFLFGGQGPNTTGRGDLRFNGANGDAYSIDAANNASGGTIDGDWHIANILFDGANSKLDIDGSNIISANAGSDNRSGMSLGELLRATGFHFNGRVGEYLEYEKDKTSVENDIESYLNSKWAVY
jgi:hypothetical protein